MNAPTHPQAPVLVKADAMASMLSVSRSSLYQLVRDGVIPSVSVGNMTRFDPGQVLNALGVGRRVEVPGPGR